MIKKNTKNESFRLFIFYSAFSMGPKKDNDKKDKKKEKEKATTVRI